MSVEAQFAEMGARVRVREDQRWSFVQRRARMGWLNPNPRAPRYPAIDIRRDGKGEYFDIAMPKGVSVEAIDVRKDLRHLVLLSRDANGTKGKYLCGHDERHWFVAAVPEAFGATTVDEAKRALQPDELKDLTAHLPKAKRIARHNEVYRRQGEWFFVAEPEFVPDPKDVILRNEPLRRDARSKPHIVAEAVRSGGERRWIPSTTSRGLTRNRERAREIDAALGNRPAMMEGEMKVLAERFPEVLWSPVIVNPTMYVRGPVRHSDHKTLVLRGWHRVVMNAERMARSAPSIAFID